MSLESTTRSRRTADQHRAVREARAWSLDSRQSLVDRDTVEAVHVPATVKVVSASAVPVPNFQLLDATEAGVERRVPAMALRVRRGAGGLGESNDRPVTATGGGRG